MSIVIDYKNPSEPELSEQDKELLAWLKSTPTDELSKAMSSAMDEVDSDLSEGGICGAALMYYSESVGNKMERPSSPAITSGSLPSHLSINISPKILSVRDFSRS